MIKFLSLLQPLPRLAQHLLLLIPGYNCSSQEQPAALQLHEEGLLLSKLVIPRLFSNGPSLLKPEKGRANARWCVGGCLFLPGSGVRIWPPGLTCCVIFECDSASLVFACLT